ncbi:MAG: type II toxin-antitoxin system BrnA family antitoxin [Desulfococcaceae bacterium]
MKAKNFDRKFERCEDVTEHLDLAHAKRVSRETKRVNVDFPLWMIESLDREARRLGVTRQSIIKIWLAERLDSPIERNPPPAEPSQIP